MPINRASSFLEDKTFPINKLKRQKSKEILQYQHNNNKINNNNTINKDESDMEISSSDVSSINGKNEDTNSNYKLKTISQKNCFLKHDENFYLEPLRGKQKRPKFLLDFKILGLNNIPLASSFLEDKTFPINKLKRQKSKEILQYQHNNNKINNNSTINKDESDMDISSSDVSSINGKNEDTNNNYKLKSISQKNCFLKHDENFYLEPLRGKQKRPKFLLDFKILGLNNIPLFNENANNEDKIGVCYVKWSLLDHNHDHIFGSKKTSKNNVIYLRDYEALDFFADNKELLNLKNSPKNKNSQTHHQHHHQHGY
ncbi:hypothetical protein HANVADRAFT_196, partial [Hanseniaspora valbyensis NRRL Y-1626]